MYRKAIIGAGMLTIAAMAVQLIVASKNNGPQNLAEIRYHQSISEWMHSPVIDYIVVGEVISQGESRIIPDTVTPIEFQKRIEENGGLAGYIATDYTFQILHILKGEDLKAGDAITIVQIGGSVNGFRQETPIENPPLEAREQAILSLFYDPRDPTVSPEHKKYAVITQPEVRYRINNGKIELMPGEWRSLFGLEEFVKLEGLSEADFIQITEKEKTSSEP